VNRESEGALEFLALNWLAARLRQREFPDRLLERQLRSPLAKITSRLSSTLGMMKKSGELLVTAGKADVFSPLGFFVARKSTQG
jgi:hypothetical protein